MKKLMFFIILAVVFQMPAPAFALSCAEPSPVELAYEEYDAVVIGKVTGIGSAGGMKKMTLEVEKSFKGVTFDKIIVYEDLTWGESQEGTTYLYFLNYDGGKWIHPLCSPTTFNTELADEAYADKQLMSLEEVESENFASNNATNIVLMSILFASVLIGGTVVLLAKRKR